MAGGVVLNDDRKPSPVVHQYDRILKSTGPMSPTSHGHSKTLLRIKAVDDALGGGLRSDSSWMVSGA